ncbi:hypothetical protein FEAC_10750 [Ferrimicrobium acidiphilum DSM 19497]|uniref:Uncharacterized protein n=1 Tax=Ferrimicrobium acidiphilum DSM 19497 TaxID=1121877 RepID=A0A0D8FV38_9ACTN|nr:hypothetical protein FEAC_10750 [Ferrimicrobium acidiphilum DSM 19497]
MDLIDDDDVFETGARPAHLFGHPHLGVDDIYDVWAANRCCAWRILPTHWLMRVDGPLSVLHFLCGATSVMLSISAPLARRRISPLTSLRPYTGPLPHCRDRSLRTEISRPRWLRT